MAENNTNIYELFENNPEWTATGGLFGIEKENHDGFKSFIAFLKELKLQNRNNLPQNKKLLSPRNFKRFLENEENADKYQDVLAKVERMIQRGTMTELNFIDFANAMDAAGFLDDQRNLVIRYEELVKTIRLTSPQTELRSQTDDKLEAFKEYLSEIKGKDVPTVKGFINFLKREDNQEKYQGMDNKVSALFESGEAKESDLQNLAQNIESGEADIRTQSFTAAINEIKEKPEIEEISRSFNAPQIKPAEQEGIEKEAEKEPQYGSFSLGQIPNETDEELSSPQKVDIGTIKKVKENPESRISEILRSTSGSGKAISVPKKGLRKIISIPNTGKLNEGALRQVAKPQKQKKESRDSSEEQEDFSQFRNTNEQEELSRKQRQSKKKGSFAGKLAKGAVGIGTASLAGSVIAAGGGEAAAKTFTLINLFI